MHVKIVGFKCHLDVDYNFDTNAMILLKGPSGVGKSTVLQAIYWCFYGSMKGIYNNAGIMKKCNVTIQLNNLIIYRQKGPELLRVTYQDTNGQEVTHEDEVAQQIINQTLGSKELWKSCSYIEQKDRCSLLSGTAAERLALLNQLSFDQDDPKYYIDKIDQELKALNKQFIEEQAVFTTELNLFTQQITHKPAKFTLSDVDIITIRKQIEEQEKESQRLYQEVLSHERVIGSYSTLKTQLSTLSSVSFDEKNNYDEKSYHEKCQQLNNEIQSMKNLLTNINHYGAIKQQLDTYNYQLNTQHQELTNITQQLEIMEKNINPNEIKVNVTDQMIWQTSQQEMERQTNLNECSSLGCNYDISDIKTKLNELHRQLNRYQEMEMYKRTFNELSSLQKQFIPNSDVLSELENTKNNIMMEISELKKGLELLQCPSCAKSLRYHNRQLILENGNPVNPQQIQAKNRDLESIQNRINKYHQTNSLQIRIESLEKQLSGIVISEEPIIDVRNLITKLMGIKVIPVPTYDSTTLKRIYEQNKLLSECNQLTAKKQQLIISIGDLENKIRNIQLPSIPFSNTNDMLLSIKQAENMIKRLNEEYQKYLQKKAEYQQSINTQKILSQQIAELEKSLRPNSQSLYQNSIVMIKELKTKLDDGLYGNTIVAKQKQLEQKRNEVILINNDLTTLQRLKQKAIEVECKQLQDTVDTINSSIEEMLPLFFNEPITVTLQLYKTLKTKKETKPGLNIVIKYKGAEYDNINQLSGGEGDRISLSLVLALNSVSNSPLIMLDECISSLDGPLKEACIEAIKTLENKTIICVDHEGTEGFYDKTIVVDA